MEIIIRYAMPCDIPGMGRVYADTWKAAYKGMIPEEYLHDLTAERWETRYRQTLGGEGMPKAAVMTLDGQIIGVSSFNITRDEDLPEGFGEIISLYVLKEYWQQGLGRKLLDWVTGEMKTIGYTHCALWTLKDNIRAQKAYERFGFARDGKRKTIKIGGAELLEIRYRKALTL